MSEQTTKSFQLAHQFACRFKQKREKAFQLLNQQGGGIVTVPFDDFWSEEDANALDAFEDHIQALQGSRRLPFPNGESR